ncbi:hypothetical protein [Kitasatospora sp. NPDC058218]|uniref:hypothetical protein n=1 Tax=Kitasatospora sp. NPDC058218 TaxID=3346385 RepID=UPI0036DB6EC8
MTRETLLTGLLVLGVGVGPAGLVLGFAMAEPDRGRGWVLAFVVLALAMIGTVYGPEWVEGWQHRRRARARVRAASRRSAGRRRNEP